jgi:DNA-binding SARP family transcriptional activator
VLALLLLEAGRVVSTDRLIEALWSGDPPATATASLQNFVSQLRKVLGAETIETRPPGYLIRVEAGQLDLARARRLVDEARASDPSRRARMLGEALSLWRGEPLAELAYESFAQAEIARLVELRLALIEERAEAELAVGRHSALVSDLEALVREHPLRERLRGQLMLALYRSGRQADALAVYRAGRTASRVSASSRVHCCNGCTDRSSARRHLRRARARRPDRSTSRSWPRCSWRGGSRW